MTDVAVAHRGPLPLRTRPRGLAAGRVAWALEERTRVAALALVMVSCATACGPGMGGEARPTAPTESKAKRSTADLEAARELDQQGVRLFTEGRYHDAIEYFRAALAHGGPSTELWNIARCQLKRDDAESAAETLEQYLSRKDVLPADRAEAKRELAELRARTSRFTVISRPARALVFVDDKRVGRAPLTVDLAPGEHTVRLEVEGHTVLHRIVRARLGRSVLVEWELDRK